MDCVDLGWSLPVSRKYPHTATRILWFRLAGGITKEVKKHLTIPENAFCRHTSNPLGTRQEFDYEAHSDHRMRFGFGLS